MPAANLPAQAPNKALFGGVMGLAWVVAVGAAILVAQSLGGAGQPATLAAAAVALGGLVTFAPLLARGAAASHFGVFVLGASGARLLLILAIGFAFHQTKDLGEAKKAFWVATMAGAGLILIVESALAVRMLTRLEHAKANSTPSAGRPAAR